MLLSQPVVAATWLFGDIAVEAAATTLAQGGSAVDAVEAGTRAVEVSLAFLSASSSLPRSLARPILQLPPTSFPLTLVVDGGGLRPTPPTQADLRGQYFVGKGGLPNAAGQCSTAARPSGAKAFVLKKV